MKTINEFSNLELLNELTKRGYNTELIFHEYLVESIQEEINEERAEDEQIILNNEDRKSILQDSINSEFFIRLITENIENQILEF
jgi:hypothetical protein